MNKTLRRVVLLLLVTSFFSSFLVSASDVIGKIGQPAEWDKAKSIIVYTPQDEIFWGIIHPKAALFEGVFSLKQAQKEHKNYINLLEKNGIKVYRVNDIILQGTVDKNGNAIEGNELKELQEFAGEFLTYDTSKLSKSEQQEEEKYKQKVIKSLSPYQLKKILFINPTVNLYNTSKNTGFAAKYELDPLMNTYFLRDQMITTGKGIVIGKFNSVQRAKETKIIKFVLHKLGIKPIYEVTGKGRLEGGDFYMAGDVAFIGNGLRTNTEGIQQLLDNKVFGTEYVVVVKDNWKNQDQMHLDCYFNIIAPKLAVLAANRMTVDGKPASPKKILKADIYKLIDGKYELKKNNIDFLNYLEKTLKFKVIPVSVPDQLKYGANFLTISSDKILGIDGVSNKYKETLKNAGVDATWMDFKNLTQGYGAAHCTTQVIQRVK